MTSYTKERSRLTDQALVARLETLARRERITTLRVLLLLGELDRRRLHVTLGYASLFDFATRRLGYSASAAGRRIQAARCIRRHPEVIALLRRNEMNLSTVALVSRILTDANKSDVLARVRNRSQREVEAIVAAHDPRVRFRDRVRPVSILLPAAVQPAVVERVLSLTMGVHPSQVQTSQPVTSVHSRSGSERAEERAEGRAEERAEEHATEHAGEHAEPAEASVNGNSPRRPEEVDTRCAPRVGTVEAAGPQSLASVGRSGAEQRFVVQFAARHRFIAKLEQVRALLSTRATNHGLEQVFEAGLDAFLDRHSPTRRRERRQARRQARSAARRREPASIDMHATRSDATSQERHIPSSKRNTPIPGALPLRQRRVPAPLRDAVFARDGSQCTFVGPEGERCNATHYLQIDHVQPFALGGAHAIENLRVLCAVHNQLEAVRAYGGSFTEPPGSRFTPRPA